MLITFIMNIVGSFTLSVSIAIAFSCLYIKLGPIFYAKKIMRETSHSANLPYPRLPASTSPKFKGVSRPFYNV